MHRETLDSIFILLIACVKQALSGHVFLHPLIRIELAYVSILLSAITILDFNHVLLLIKIVIQRRQTHLRIKDQTEPNYYRDWISKANNISYAVLPFDEGTFELMPAEHFIAKSSKKIAICP